MIKLLATMQPTLITTLPTRSDRLVKILANMIKILATMQPQLINQINQTNQIKLADQNIGEGSMGVQENIRLAILAILAYSYEHRLRSSQNCFNQDPVLKSNVGHLLCFPDHKR